MRDAPAMADNPYTDESARAILEYFAWHDLRGGDETPRWALEQQFFENREFRRDDFEAELSYAVEKAMAQTGRGMFRPNW